MFRASLAHHQEFKETVCAARCRIQLFLLLSFVCHVLYLRKVLWVLEWCAMVVLLVVCGELPSNKEHKKLQLVGIYMIIVH